MEDSENFGKILKTLRTDAHMTQAALAAAIGVTPKTVSAYEHRRKAPGALMTLRIAVVFRVSLDYLLELSKRKSPDLPDERWRKLEKQYLNV